MINRIKNILAGIVINKKLKDRNISKQSYHNLLEKSFNYLVLLPNNDDDFRASLSVLNYLDSNKKHVQVFTQDFKVSLIPQKFHLTAIDYGIEDISKLNLPGKRLTEKLSSLNVDAVIDLNRSENLFCSYAAVLVNSPLSIGITKKQSDKFYNLQFANSDDNSDMFYKNFLNCLLMF